MNSFEIRKKFLEFFEKNGHSVVASSSLIPAEDPTLLFTNAGMNQFKDCFLGKEKRSYVRATSSQKCVRAGGKHNDLDQVGFTERHLTFFEMLGNFSFGDYFKEKAIAYAWEFLTKEMKLPQEKLYASVFKDDQEAYDIWLKQIGLPPERIIKLGESDNFWAMGDTGPCGPCTEIYLDRGPHIGCKQASCAPGCSCARFIEIWNNVFMQYDRQPDGVLKPLEQTGVDTGMGLERLCMVIQGEDNVFHADQVKCLIEEVENLVNISYEKSPEQLQAAFRVLADHVRTSALLIADGCSPSNEGRGYVLRKIIRRAALFAEKLSRDQSLFPELAKRFIAKMSLVWPELKTSEKLILAVLESEIEKFATNLVNGKIILEKYLDENRKAGRSNISGAEQFKLYDTYGFPPELTELIVREHGFTTDRESFDAEMKKQQTLSGKKMKEGQTDELVVENIATKFVGYETLQNKSKVQFFAQFADHAWLSTEESPFYVECGGQVNDNGWMIINNQKFEIIDLKKAGETFNPAILVKIGLKTVDGEVAKAVNVGDIAESFVDPLIRPNTVKNHTATHMLQAALISVLGPQVKQAGSVVNDKYLRFDFTHHKPMSKEEVAEVETIINQKIQEDIKTNIQYATLPQAKAQGVISFFGEKYNPDQVRIVEIPGFSAELCGGTHASSTGVIGSFKIVSDAALATGTRRIVAVTGPEALKLFQQSFTSVKHLGETFKVKPEEVVGAVERTLQQQSELLSQIRHLKRKLYQAHIPTWQSQITPVANKPFCFITLEDAANDEIKQICEELSAKTPGFYFFVSKSTKEAERFSFVAYVSKEVTAQVDLKAFGIFLKDQFGLKGGGSAQLIQGGGTTMPARFKDLIMEWLKK